SSSWRVLLRQLEFESCCSSTEISGYWPDVESDWMKARSPPAATASTVDAVHSMPVAALKAGAGCVSARSQPLYQSLAAAAHAAATAAPPNRAASAAEAAAAPLKRAVKPPRVAYQRRSVSDSDVERMQFSPGKNGDSVSWEKEKLVSTRSIEEFESPLLHDYHYIYIPGSVPYDQSGAVSDWQEDHRARLLGGPALSTRSVCRAS
uniref:ELM2 domain-containing protein n=1 Tax=Macrostomum lignano TaxID=282301 RepID=A0A1I8FGX0_9PLAT